MDRKAISFLFILILTGFLFSGCGRLESLLQQSSNVIYPPGKPVIVRTAATTAVLTWEASTTEAIAGYYIYRGTTTEGTGLSNIGNTVFSVKTYSDSGLISSQEYYYSISAINTTQESAKSDAVYVAPYSGYLPIVVSGGK